MKFTPAGAAPVYLMAGNGWKREFPDPIPLPDRRTLVTLRDAADYIANLPKKESALPEWQAAIEALMVAVEHGRPQQCWPGSASCAH